MSEILTRDQWLAERAKHITATDIGAIIGVNPFSSKLRIWLEKTGRAEPLEDNLAMWCGRSLQATVLNRYQIETGVEVRHCADTEIVVSKEFPLASATPDGEGKADLRVVEAKAILGRSSSLKWGEPETENAVPDMYYVQCVWQGMVLEQDVVDLAALIVGPMFKVYPIVRGRDRAFEDQLREEAERFWRDFVVADRMPPVDASKEASDFLAKMFPTHTKQLLPAPDEAEEIKAELLLAKGMKEEYEIQEDLAKNRLREIIGENEGLLFQDGSRAKWSKTKDGEKVDWEAVAKQTGSKISRVEFEQIVKKYTKPVLGIRKFYSPKGG